MQGAGTSVLAIEDELDVQELLARLLSRNGYRIALAGTGREGLRLFHQRTPDIVLLDVGLPDLEGWDVLERLRDMSDVPVLLLTGRAEEPDKVRGLGAGADDYITKPFGPQELLARLYAMARRQGGSPPAPVFDDGRLHVDLGRQEVEVDGRAVALTPTEYRLLTALCQQAGEVLSGDELLERAWGEEGGENPERIKYAMLRLRRKLGWDDPGASPLESVRGFGYRYRPQP